jgi:hypothetical protein
MSSSLIKPPAERAPTSGVSRLDAQLEVTSRIVDSARIRVGVPRGHRAAEAFTMRPRIAEVATAAGVPPRERRRRGHSSGDAAVSDISGLHSSPWSWVACLADAAKLVEDEHSHAEEGAFGGNGGAAARRVLELTGPGDAEGDASRASSVPSPPDPPASDDEGLESTPSPRALFLPLLLLRLMLRGGAREKVDGDAQQADRGAHNTGHVVYNATERGQPREHQ